MKQHKPKGGYIMKNSNAVAIVAEMITAKNEGKRIVKKEFAAKHNISARTLSRYEVKYSEAANTKIAEFKKAAAEFHTGAKASKTGTAVDKKISKKDSKKDIAVTIFVNMSGAKRKEVIAEFMDKAGLSKAGASTYYFNIKKELSK
jgi:hypothetical protein